MASIRNGLLTRPWALQTFKFSHIFCLYSKALSKLPKTWLISNNICQIDWKPSDISKSNIFGKIYHSYIPQKGCWVLVFLKSAGSVQILINTENKFGLIFFASPNISTFRIHFISQEVTWWSHMKILSSRLSVPFLTQFVIIILCSFLLYLPFIHANIYFM